MVEILEFLFVGIHLSTCLKKKHIPHILAGFCYMSELLIEILTPLSVYDYMYLHGEKKSFYVACIQTAKFQLKENQKKSIGAETKISTQMFDY